jgi:hypothetical protein
MDVFLLIFVEFARRIKNKVKSCVIVSGRAPGETLMVFFCGVAHYGSLDGGPAGGARRRGCRAMDMMIFTWGVFEIRGDGRWMGDD